MDKVDCFVFTDNSTQSAAITLLSVYDCNSFFHLDCNVTSVSTGYHALLGSGTSVLDHLCNHRREFGEGLPSGDLW